VKQQAQRHLYQMKSYLKKNWEKIEDFFVGVRKSEKVFMIKKT
jgi:hypothetical protein